MGLLRAAVLAAVAAVVAAPAASAQRPPRLILEGEAGSRWAAQESFCVNTRTGDGASRCAQTPSISACSGF